MKIPSYPKVYQLGHPNIADIFAEPFVVQEKVDGSQVSASVQDGQLHMRSKRAELRLGSKDGLFGPAMETFESLFEAGNLVEGVTYRGEAVARPKHNTLVYERAPEGGVILFDIEDGLTPLSLEDASDMAKSLGLEFVPQYSLNKDPREEDFLALLDQESVLGGTKIEGIVIKSLHLYARDGKRMMGKYVSEKFKEVHQARWKADNPNRKDLVENIIAGLKTEARWVKAVQRLEELGVREYAPKDIGALVKVVPQDIKSECEDQIKEVLFKHFWQEISRGCVKGLASWYKERLLHEQFEDTEGWQNGNAADC